MALRDMIDRVRDNVSQMAYRFLHGEDQGYYEQQPGYGQQEGYYDPSQQAAYGPDNGGYGQYDGAYGRQQPGYGQQAQQPFAQQPPAQQAYQQPGYGQQEAYPPQDGGYQSPYAGSFARQAQPQQRPVRAASPAPEKVVPFPGMNSDGAGNVFAHELQILQLRDRDECRAIIEYLKNNCTVALNMDNIANDTEKQRCVDMLSGAAYTLNCNINRISTRGVYVITPEAVRVQADEATRRLNGAARQQGTRPSRAHSYAAGRGRENQEGYDGQESGYNAYPPQGGYAPQEETGYAGYQQSYETDGEYRTAEYNTQSTRRAVGYGR